MIDTKTIAKLACCMALVLGTAAVVAQQPSTSAGRKPGDLDEIRKVSALIGTDVMNHTNARIASLRDLLLDPDGAIQYAVLGCGGVAGVGETYTAVPVNLLGIRHDDGKWAANLDMTADDLTKAPAIKSENYRELTDPQWIARVDQFIRARGESEHHPERTTGAAKREQRPVRHVLLATKLRAANLKNVQNEHLGKIEDLLLDRMHRVAFVIVGRGGVFGIGESYIPVPWSRLGLGSKVETAAVTVTIDASKARFETAPLVKGDYATLLAPGFAEQVRQYFGASGPEAGAGREPE